jgi:hypothetical protein
MMAIETGLTLAGDLKETPLWGLSFVDGEPKVTVMTPSLLGETLRKRMEKGGIHFDLEV